MNKTEATAGDKDQKSSGRQPVRAPYAPPRLDHLGEWSALTLQQSIPIFP